MARSKKTDTTPEPKSQSVRGRPKKHPPTRTASDASSDSRRALRDRGGRLVQVALEADQVQALEAMRAARGLSSDKEAIAAAILDARFVLDLLVRLTKEEAEALATVRTETGAKSDRDAVAAAIMMAARAPRGT